MAIFGSKNFNTGRFKRKLLKFANVFGLTSSRFVDLFRLIPEFHGYWNWVTIISGGFSRLIVTNQRKKIHLLTLISFKIQNAAAISLRTLFP